ESSKNKQSLTDMLRANPFIFSTVVLGVLAMAFLIILVSGGSFTGKVISGDEAGQTLLEFYESVGAEGLILLSVEDVSGVYKITFDYEGSKIPVYITKDGKFAGSLSAVTPLGNDGDSVKPDETILECVGDYGISEDTIIFYYSNSCGWCSKMKPGVTVLEQKGYNIFRIEAGGEDDSIIDDCVRAHMTSSGVPQFICVKTGEIKVGAFTDNESNLNQEALDKWAESCVS
ncbi:MAG: hypothetical protein PHU63_04065, partial [Candidatus ainarchaeum sp.]|nr:hypothetical protein [Candidatus ainarchaeum sp.]